MKGIGFILFFLFASHLHSQEIISALPRWMAGGHVHLLYPQQPIREFLDDAQVGYQFEFQYRLQYNKPFMAGVYFGESTLSRYVIRYNQSSGGGTVEIKEKANTRRIEPGLSIGFYPEINWLIQPYILGRAGLAIYQTSSILTDTDTKEQIERISEFTSAAPSYGLDIGMHVVPNIWYLRWDVRVGFYGNTSTPYMTLGEVEPNSGGLPIEYYETHRSAAKWLKVSAGLSYLF